MRADSERLRRALRRVELELDRTVPQALALIADHVVNDARSTRLFRDRSGLLRRSILRGPISGSFASGSLSVDVRAGGAGSVRYAEFVHEGTRAHVIRPRRRSMLRFVSGGSFVFARSVQHPGTSPRPFIRDAVDRARPFAERTLAGAMRLAFARAGVA